MIQFKGATQICSLLSIRTSNRDQWLCPSNLIFTFIRIIKIVLVFKIHETKAFVKITKSLPFSDKCSRHIETNQLICRENQLTGFYMIGTLIVKELILSTKLSWKENSSNILKGSICLLAFQETPAKKFIFTGLATLGKKTKTAIPVGYCMKKSDKAG